MLYDFIDDHIIAFVIMFLASLGFILMAMDIKSDYEIDKLKFRKNKNKNTVKKIFNVKNSRNEKK